MDRQIGEVAGRMWPSLAPHGTGTLPPLQCGTTLPERLLPRGLAGWHGQCYVALTSNGESDACLASLSAPPL
jgi:hypothetical protein